MSYTNLIMQSSQAVTQNGNV